MIRRDFLLLLSLFLVACTTQPIQPSVMPELVEVSVLNMSDRRLTKVEIYVAANHSKVVCEQVAPQGFCANQFRPRSYQGHTAIVTWQVGGQQWQHEITAQDVSTPQGWRRFG